MATLIQQLVTLGLTRQEIDVYISLLKEGPQTAKSLSIQLDILPNAVYRTAKSLEKRGFLGTVKTSPRTFQAKPSALSISSLASKQIEVLQQLTGQAGDLHGPTKIKMFFGKETIFNLGAKLLNKTDREMLVISIGEEITPNLLLAVVRAKERGVTIKMIVHKYDNTNKFILQNFKKSGYEIRHFPDWGFHLAIYDSSKSIIIVDDSKDTNERVALLIKSDGLSRVLHSYFYSVWMKAKKV